LTLEGLGIGKGHEVILPANTFIATALAVSAAGATPVLVDCDSETYTLDVAAVEASISARTGAVIPVHLYGQVAEMDPLIRVAGRKGLKIVEDACQAHGATYKGRRCGSLGEAGCFSFYPAKNLGAFGDGGAIVTSDPALAQNVRLLRNYGSAVKYVHEVQGDNSRLDALQAAVLRVKLRRLEDWNASRRRIASRYSEEMGDLPVKLPHVSADSQHVFHLYVIQVDRRDQFLKVMQSSDIDCGIHYPRPIHLQPAYARLGYDRGSFPVSESIAERLVSLPIYPEMTDDQVGQVVQAVRSFFGRA